MIVVKVSYSVQDAYVATNIEMIQSFLAEFKKLDQSQFVYTIFQNEGNNTFIHLSQYANKDIQQTLLNLPKFLHFQEQRDLHLASEPVIEILNFIGSSKNVFEI